MSEHEPSDKPLHILVRHRFLASAALVGVAGFGVTLMFGGIFLGGLLSLFCAVGTASIYYDDLLELVKRNPSLEVFFALGLIVIETVIPFYIYFDRPIYSSLETGQNRSAGPCEQVTALGFKCSADDLAQAISGGNVQIIKLLIDGGVGLDQMDHSSTVLEALRRSPRPIQIATLREMQKKGLTSTSSDECYATLTGLGQNITIHSRVGCELTALGPSLYCAMKAVGFSDPALEGEVSRSAEAEKAVLTARYNSHFAPGRCSADAVLPPGQLYYFGPRGMVSRRDCLSDPGCISEMKANCMSRSAQVIGWNSSLESYLHNHLSFITSSWIRGCPAP